MTHLIRLLWKLTWVDVWNVPWTVLGYFANLEERGSSIFYGKEATGLDSFLLANNRQWFSSRATISLAHILESFGGYINLQGIGELSRVFTDKNQELISTLLKFWSNIWIGNTCKLKRKYTKRNEKRVYSCQFLFIHQRYSAIPKGSPSLPPPLHLTLSLSHIYTFKCSTSKSIQQACIVFTEIFQSPKCL